MHTESAPYTNKKIDVCVGGGTYSSYLSFSLFRLQSNFFTERKVTVVLCYFKISINIFQFCSKRKGK
jgi:hypothetical protein